MKRGARSPRLFGKLRGKRDRWGVIRWGAGAELRSGFTAWYSTVHHDWCWQISSDIHTGVARNLKLAVKLIEETVRGARVRYLRASCVIEQLMGTA
jgi:hypothetical protein